MPKPKLTQVAKVGGLLNREEFYGQQGQRARLNKMRKRRRARAAAKRSAAAVPVFVTLPITLDFTAGIPTAPDWSYQTESGGTKSSVAPDAHGGHTPATSPILRVISSTDQHWNLQYNGWFNAGLKLDLTQGLRVQWYCGLHSGLRRQFQCFLWDQAQGWIDDGFDCFVSTQFSAPNDKLFMREWLASVSNTLQDDSNPGTGYDFPDSTPHWVRMNLEITPTQMKYYEEIEGTVTTGLVTHALTQDHSLQSIDTVNFRGTAYTSAHTIDLVNIWLGTSADAFPT